MADTINERLRYEDLTTNPANRLPICLCIDCSYSMLGERMNAVNDNVRRFIQEGKDDIIAVDTIELCIVTFGGEARMINPFIGIERVEFENFTPVGATPLGEAVNMSLDAIKARQNDYDEFGITGYKPWLIIMSDGEATDPSAAKEASRRVRELLDKNEIKVACIDMSNGTESSLQAFTPDGGLPISALRIGDFFSLLSSKAASMSSAAPGDDDMFEILSASDKNDLSGN